MDNYTKVKALEIETYIKRGNTDDAIKALHELTQYTHQMCNRLKLIRRDARFVEKTLDMSPTDYRKIASGIIRFVDGTHGELEAYPNENGELSFYSKAEIEKHRDMKPQGDTMNDDVWEGFGFPDCPQCGSAETDFTTANDHESDSSKERVDIKCDTCGYMFKVVMQKRQSNEASGD